MSNFDKDSLSLHKKYGGKIEIKPTVEIDNANDLSLAYTPGVGSVCKSVADGEVEANEVISTKRMVAIITDGSAILGLGNIGAVAGLPVMEGKAILLKKFAGVDAFPIALDTQDVEEVIKTIKNIAPTFGAINLEDISAPRCFEIEKRLISELDMPVFHDDQHGTAIVVLAALKNALKIVNKNELDKIKIVINGVGAAGAAIAELLIAYGFKHLTIVDSSGVLGIDRACDISGKKQHLCSLIKHVCNYGDTERCTKSSLEEVITGADVFIGVSAPGVLTKEMVSTMNEKAIVFALANPTPEIMPSEALSAGASVVATGRSDFPNQVNNALVFPGLFKGLFDADIKQVTLKMKIAVAEALAATVKDLSADKIIPDMFDGDVVENVAQAVISMGKSN